jgi:hypothetical protein
MAQDTACCDVARVRATKQNAPLQDALHTSFTPSTRSEGQPPVAAPSSLACTGSRLSGLSFGLARLSSMQATKSLLDVVFAARARISYVFCRADA